MNPTRILLVIIITLTLTLSVSLEAPALAQPAFPVIRITANGAIDPASAAISRSGETYILTGNVQAHGIVIERAGITLDGAGYTLMGPYNGTQSLWIIGEGPDQPLTNDTELWSIGVDVATEEVGRLTIRNLNIKNFSIGMYMWSHGNQVLGNNISETIVAILDSGSDNKFTQNTLADNKNGVFFGAAEGAIPQNLLVAENSFINNTRQLGGCVCIDYNTTEPMHYWDNGRRGNFWSDYNGTDANGDGIGDTPYVIDVLNQDRYPLVYSIATPAISAETYHLVSAIAVIAVVAAAVVAVLHSRRQKEQKQAGNIQT